MTPAPWRIGERRKSSYSDAANGCVEAELTPTGVDLRDTKHAGAGPVIHFDLADWRRFVTGDVPPGVRVSHRPLAVDYPGRRAHTTHHVHTDGRTLHFTDHEWSAFQLGAAAGEFDPPH